MVFKTGIDMVEISRIEKSIQNKRFLDKVYGSSEMEYFKNNNMPVQSMAAAFCVKEAFGKLIGTGISGFSLNEVEVLHEQSGKPYLKLSGKANEIAQNEGLNFDLSITHTKDYATAVVVAYAS